MSVLERCAAYREYSYSKRTEKRQGSAPGVCCIEVSVKRELTVPTDQSVFIADQIALLKPFLSILFNQSINQSISQSFILTR